MPAIDQNVAATIENVMEILVDLFGADNLVEGGDDFRVGVANAINEQRSEAINQLLWGFVLSMSQQVVIQHLLLRANGSVLVGRNWTHNLWCLDHQTWKLKLSTDSP